MLPINDNTINNIQATLLIFALVLAFVAGSLTYHNEYSSFIYIIVTVLLVAILIAVSMLESYQNKHM